MKNENISLYYKSFIEFTAELIEIKDNNYKENLKQLSIKKEKTELEKEIKKLLKNNIVESEQKLLEINNNQYMINIIKDKKIYLTKEMYSLFFNRIIYDMLYNNYRRNEIINNWFDKTIIIKENKSNLIYDKNDLEPEMIYELYNNRISDKYYEKVGINYDRMKKTKKLYKTNTKYCEQEIKIEDDEGVKYKYYSFDSLLKTNEIYYSDCIYYHIGKKIFDLKENIIETSRSLIANKIKDNIEKNYFIYKKKKYRGDLQYFIEVYNDLADIHLYNTITTTGELLDRLTSQEHWITELDLAVITELKSDITLKIMYSIRDDNVIDKVRTLGNGKNIHYIYLETFYNKNLYYYLEKE